MKLRRVTFLVSCINCDKLQLRYITSWYSIFTIHHIFSLGYVLLNVVCVALRRLLCVLFRFIVFPTVVLRFSSHRSRWIRRFRCVTSSTVKHVTHTSHTRHTHVTHTSTWHVSWKRSRGSVRPCVRQSVSRWGNSVAGTQGNRNQILLYCVIMHDFKQYLSNIYNYRQ